MPNNKILLHYYYANSKLKCAYMCNKQQTKSTVYIDHQIVFRTCDNIDYTEDKHLALENISLINPTISDYKRWETLIIATIRTTTLSSFSMTSIHVTPDHDIATCLWLF